jgi:hypothetical protein
LWNSSADAGFATITLLNTAQLNTRAPNIPLIVRFIFILLTYGIQPTTPPALPYHKTLRRPGGASQE